MQHRSNIDLKDKWRTMVKRAEKTPRTEFDAKVIELHTSLSSKKIRELHTSTPSKESKQNETSSSPKKSSECNAPTSSNQSTARTTFAALNKSTRRNTSASSSSKSYLQNDERWLSNNSRLVCEDVCTPLRDSVKNCTVKVPTGSGTLA